MIDFFSRLDIYMKFRGLNDNKITLECSLANGIIGKARKRGALSQENISKILHTYPDLNANWLFTGKGKMLMENDSNTNTRECYSCIEKQKMIDLQSVTIDALKEVVAQLKMHGIFDSAEHGGSERGQKRKVG